MASALIADADADAGGSTTVSDDTDCADAGEASSSVAATDCDDSDATIHPGAAETPADGIDSDCDGTEDCLLDFDGDGFAIENAATITSNDGACTDPGEATASTIPDCDDTDPTIYPGAQETVVDGIDQDCDGEDGTDNDGDGYPAPGDGVTPDIEDCNADAASIPPGAGDVADENADWL